MPGEGLVPTKLDEDAMAAFLAAPQAAGRRSALGPGSSRGAPNRPSSCPSTGRDCSTRSCNWRSGSSSTAPGSVLPRALSAAAARLETLGIPSRSAPYSAGIRRARTYGPRFRRCRPTLVTVNRHLPTGICRRPRNCSRWPPPRGTHTDHGGLTADDVLSWLNLVRKSVGVLDGVEGLP
jgi:hypothetical protein